MSATSLLGLPLIDAAQSQKHVTHNTALLQLDGIVQLAVASRNTTAPPGAPNEGDRYLVGAGGTGVFASQANAVALWQSGAWVFLAPKAGWRAYVVAENVLVVFDGTQWRDPQINLPSLQNVGLLGVGTSADPTNRFAAKSNAVLLTARTSAEGGSGDLRVAVNKAASGNTASIVLQDNASGRAEIGLAGDDHFRVKVSPDGNAWTTAIDIDPATARVTFPGGVPGAAAAGFRNRLINGDMRVSQRGSQTVPANAVAYTACDRFYVYAGGGALVTSQASGLAVAGSTNALSIAGGVGNTALNVGQRVEAVNIADLAGQQVVLSGWLFSSVAVTPTLSIGTPSIRDNYASIAFVGSGLPALPALAANTWTYFAAALTLPGASVNGVAVEIVFGATPAGVTRQLTNLQLESGGSASAFERRPIAQEFASCQRYFATSYPLGTALGSPGSFSPFWSKTYNGDAFNFVASVSYPVTMRAPPTMTLYSPNTGAPGKAWDQSHNVDVPVNPIATPGGLMVFVNNSAPASYPAEYHVHFTASAEL